MAQSPASERRARLIREMAHELNSTRHSLRSNSDFADVTGSNLSVEEESSQAYRDHSQPLPVLPSQNRTGTRLASRPSADFVIDSSAIGRAFPDMTGSATSAEDDGSSISIELGRGLRDGARNLSDTGSVNLGPTPGQYKIDLSRLPSKGYGKTGRSSLREVQNVDEQRARNSAPSLKATAYGTSGSSGESGGENRRQPLKASVEDGSDHTDSSAQNFTARGSRFGHGHSRSEMAIPKRFTSGRDLLRDVHRTSIRANNDADGKSLKPIAENTLTTTNGGTAQSFMLPNMPNMSELVSGVYDDGTPVFSRTTAGRFQNARNPANIRNVQSLPVPQDEEAIMMSLRLLQDKISHLERTKAEAEVAIKELQNKNRLLEDERRELKRSRRSDGGAGSSGASDAGDEGLNSTHRMNLDKQRLQSTIRNLQNELDGANRRAVVAEANGVNIAAERDAAIEQLGVAFVTQEELKVDNENLKEENRRLTIDNARYRAAIDTYLKRAESERTETKSKITEEDSAQRDTRSVDCQVLDVDTPKRSPTRREEPRDITRNREDDVPAMQQPKKRRRRVIVEEYTATSDFQGFDDESIARIQEASRQLSQNLSQNISLARSTSGATVTRRTQGNERTEPKESTRHERTEPKENTKHERSRALSTRALDDDVLSVHEPSRANQTRNVTQASRVSFLQEGDVTILRKMLEKEHLQKKGRLSESASDQPPNQDDEYRDITQLVDRTRTLPHKSSMKDVTGRHTPAPDATAHTEIDEEEQTQATEPAPAAQRRRRHSEASLAPRKTGHAKAKVMEDMTSAFILPDITMSVRPRDQSGGEADVSAPLSIPIEAIQSSAPHEAQSCTVCARLSGACAQCREESDEPLKVPTPILVSERIRDLAAEGEDHTTRPSEPPAVALARTIKALEDEFAHIGMQLTALQQQYVELDPSLQKRKRKSVGASIDSLRSALDAKGDQIYALYDVLEGQGTNGQLEKMTEQEVNDTLTSVLGEDANLGNLGMPSGIMFKRGQKTSAADVTPAKERAKPRTMRTGAESVLSEVTEAKTNEQSASRPASSIGGTPIGKKLPWEDLDADEDDMSWQGFDDTLDLTKGSRKSNTSSKRRNANVSIEL